MKFALQVKDKDFDKARELLGESYDDKSNLLIFDPLTGEPPVGPFVLLAVSAIWLQKYADRISGYMNKLEDISELIKTANYLELDQKERTKSFGVKTTGIGELAAGGLNKILAGEDSNDFLKISQEEEVENFSLESEKPIFAKRATEAENSKAFSSEVGEEKKEEVLLTPARGVTSKQTNPESAAEASREILSVEKPKAFSSEFSKEEETKSLSGETASSGLAAEALGEIFPAEETNDFLKISQEEEVKNFYLEMEKSILAKGAAEEEKSNDFSSEFEEEKKEEIKEAKEAEVALTPAVGVASGQAPSLAPKVGETKRIYIRDSDMAYTVGVGIHIKYSSKVIIIVDEKMFQKYGEGLDENVYIFKTFKEVAESALQNYLLLITAEDKAQDKEILEYSKNPIVYWEEINQWAEKQK